MPEQVSRREILDAYREKSRRVHPDLNPQDRSGLMEELNSAYRLLMDYADDYKMRLTPNEDGMNDEEWWMHHFGQDPIWGGGTGED